MMDVIKNKWIDKKWIDPKLYRPQVVKKVEHAEDSTPLLKKNDAPDIEIKWNRANRIKTLRGIRK
jgi:hypothetical protein